MFFVNPFEYLIQLDIGKYLFGAFAVFGIMLMLRMLILKKGL